jgi:DNA repair exonuclease SbcCD ATPase subunit
MSVIFNPQSVAGDAAAINALQPSAQAFFRELKARNVSLDQASEELRKVENELQAAESEGQQLRTELDSAGSLDQSSEELRKVENELQAAESKQQQLKTELDSVDKELARAEADCASMPAVLAKLTEEHAEARAQLGHAKAKLENAEKIAGVSGVSPNDAISVPAEEEHAGDNSPSATYSKYSELRKNQKEGTADPGAALSFWRKHRSQLERYQESLSRK